jgi:transcriptional regulator with XRE-family HTH domain
LQRPIEIPIQLQTASAIQRLLARRVHDARLAIGLTQKTLAARAGVTLPSLRRFEQTGEISLKHLTRIFYALGRIDDFNAILRPAPAATMAELESRVNQPVRKRGSR